MKKLMKQVFEAWRTGKALDAALFSEDFVFKGPSKMIDADVWLGLRSDEHAINDVRLLCVISEQEKGAILFEWKDSFTLLQYRTSWFFSFKHGLICELIETKESVEM